MTLSVNPGPAADAADRLSALQDYQLVKNSLPRVRAAALAWRNGVGALLVGLIGFGLIKGRTDVGELASPYDAMVGFLLLAALVAGTTAALLLLRAAHGRPAAVAIREHKDSGGSALGTDHTEALRAADALLQGVVLSLACTALLVLAVGTTWYGPAKKDPRIEVTTPTGTRCGEVVRMTAGRLTLKTNSGEITVDLDSAAGMRAVDSCTSTTASQGSQ
ncbi:hypothetical protein OG689_42025 [Kitasatospora sp. NBC_00240]|uniref:hypothetical protein n=1 Tax=Kitasatospora sp. NBC_00240 TaxID=2903567 RepID=UPI0022569405|nr:hypothetical protein [Kitasatospora sp. NBC_00240]MCX5215736.1 hypothetical protein [Kitasatospora sp. NBC_00240]